MTVPLPDLFKRVTLAPGGVRINTLVGGNEAGPPVLLLHGYPQTHVMWHHVAPILALHHTVVLTDLRGYGDSGKPHGGPTHQGYAKRTMAWDQALVMRSRLRAVRRRRPRPRRPGGPPDGPGLPAVGHQARRP